ncbi:type II toxin-antitoxin system Phd/YefM family antitoxin [Variovorax sp. J22P271]|uniref:type II toxin-antitoxin system Phd/YefM family antitoxin n=1 Tax=Variovorax davisae TaxID=3053515 RepID=UPI0025791D22|nr:type II toxin-antitoxin system Phd/YefM family antitoxin [Variovorax sp. J22P271]MDM0031333.1 type II toxin-antitoxin system Phd/YefM family antitoxin [Variovorax sp. J22P271]
MMQVSSVEAQNRFGQLLDKAQREPIIITRHGRPAAYLISPQDMEALQRARAALGEVPGHPEWAIACAEAWNRVEEELGSFADEHSTL